MTLRRQTIGAVCLRALVVVLLLNAIFFALIALAARIPGSAFTARVSAAFATGALNREIDYAYFDRRTGTHQYTDCLILQFVINSEEQWLRRALGPKVYFQPDYLHACDTLFRLAHDPQSAGSFASFRYTRYWHGYYPASALLLSWFDLQTARTILKTTLYLALLVLPLAAGMRDRAIFFTALSIAITGIFFWGVPYFGQSLCHGLGDAAVIFGIALFFLLRRWVAKLDGVILYSAAFGACLTFFEFLTGLLPTGASYLFIAAFLLDRQNNGARAREAFTFPCLAIIAFAGASLLTILIKQTLAVIFVGPEAVQAFTSNLATYSASAHLGGSRLALISEAFHKMIWTSSDVLTHGDLGSAHILLAVAALAWVTAIVIACASRNREAAKELMAFLLATSIIAIWIAILPNHAIEHAFFMSRILVVPVSLGWAALACQVLTLRNKFALHPTNDLVGVAKSLK